MPVKRQVDIQQNYETSIEEELKSQIDENVGGINEIKTDNVEEENNASGASQYLGKKLTHQIGSAKKTFRTAIPAAFLQCY